jgi:hypothetical protein
MDLICRGDELCDPYSYRKECTGLVKADFNDKYMTEIDVSKTIPNPVEIKNRMSIPVRKG